MLQTACCSCHSFLVCCAVCCVLLPCCAASCCAVLCSRCLNTATICHEKPKVGWRLNTGRVWVQVLLGRFYVSSLSSVGADSTELPCMLQGSCWRWRLLRGRMIAGSGYSLWTMAPSPSQTSCSTPLASPLLRGSPEPHPPSPPTTSPSLVHL